MDNTLPIEKRYIFNASAVAFAAHIRRPADHQFKAVASSALPVTGGLAEASSGPQSYQEVISFQSASTSVSGDYADTRRAVDFTKGNFGDNELSTQTFVDARLSGLRIIGARDQGGTGFAKPVTFVAKELHARLESHSDRRGPNAFRGLEANFQGISVDGSELIVTTAPEVCTHYETYEKLVKAYHEDGDFRKRYGGLFYPTGHEKTGISSILSKPEIGEGGMVAGTVVTNLRWAGAQPVGAEIRSNRLTVPGIGTIFFGEIVYQPNTRQLTLLRFQLGSPTGGEGSACNVGSNGGGMPPSQGD